MFRHLILCLLSLLLLALFSTCKKTEEELREEQALSKLNIVEVGPVHLAKQRVWYQRKSPYAQWLNDSSVLAEVAKIMNSFTISKERWAKCYTQQEYVEKFSEKPRNLSDEEWSKKVKKEMATFYEVRQRPPNFMKQVRLPRGVRHARGIKPYHRLTFEEQLLIQRYYPFKLHLKDKLELWSSDLLGTVFSALMRKYWRDNSQKELSKPEEIFVDLVDMRMMLDPMKRLRGEAWEDWLTLWLYEYYSPITGKPFETWHKEFSPGNGYFVLLTDQTVSDVLWRNVEETDQANFLREHVYFMYYRIYGERKVIAEGIYAGYVGPPVGEARAHREIIERSYEEKLF